MPTAMFYSKNKGFCLTNKIRVKVSLWALEDRDKNAKSASSLLFYHYVLKVYAELVFSFSLLQVCSNENMLGPLGCVTSFMLNSDQARVLVAVTLNLQYQISGFTYGGF